MAESTFSINQNIFKAPHPPISVTPCSSSHLTSKVLRDFLETVDGDGVIGVAPAYGAKCVLSVVALASSTHVLLVRMSRSQKAKKGKVQGTDLLRDLILCSPSHSKVAFRMDVLATSLYHDFKLRIRSGVDLLSVAIEESRGSSAAIMSAIGGEVILQKKNLLALFKTEEKFDKSQLKDVALQAWVAWRGATLPYIATLLENVPRIDTSAFPKESLAAFAKMIRDASRLDAMKPTTVKNEIADDNSYSNGRLHVSSTRFKNRVRRLTNDQYIEIQSKNGDKQVTVTGKPTRIEGKAVKLNVQAPLPPGRLTLTTVGKEAPTDPERQRADIILRALQCTSDIAKKPFFKAIWLPGETPLWPVASSIHVVPVSYPGPLNESQRKAITAILSPQPISLIRGPPGTGKTTVIAGAVCSVSKLSSGDGTMWLVAQSNVAVKNIAEKLAAVDFLDFKIIVSKDFHFDWHEHLYEKIQPNLITSDSLPEQIVAAARLLNGSQVILCTLSMISNATLSNITQIVPVSRVVVDEASQVEIGSLLPMISLFSHTLRKLVFIGDDKQLAPYGQGDINDLKSVFEMKHLQKGAIFLNTQYRMPQQLGKFIGHHVYGGQLKTMHSNTSPSCKFVDVVNSKEVKTGLSWTNRAEVGAAVSEAENLHIRGLSYRIITPYDAQRGILENALKTSKIPWEDKVFCVDSFQGNEDDYIILSIVRTEKIGFLQEQRRVNVMLTRCKMGLRILTSRAFVEGAARESLVGRLASEIGPAAWEG